MSFVIDQFYSGSWLTTSIRQHDEVNWCLPTPVGEHIESTGEPEEMLLSPEDFDAIPENVGIGQCEWVITFTDGHDESFYSNPAPNRGGWYVINFNPFGTGFYTIIPDGD